MEYRIDGELAFRHSIHQYLSDVLELDYGNNLDGLFDELTVVNDTTIVLSHPDIFLERLGGYGKTMLRVFHDAAEENPGFKFRIEFEQLD